MTADEKQVRETHDTWIAAVNAADLGTLLGMVTDDLVLINPSGEPIGVEGFAGKFTSAHGQLRIHCSSELEEVVVAGDVAYTRSRDALRVSPRDGDGETRLAGYRLTIYRRQADGRWLLARDAHTLAEV
ncbi:SgcJ/EcaC family oxidoreductase [Luteolibacter flavescens]|uniref:SgcJ/EcaC family oxidoreductase n=1 Tax=Luteolibacter flavescens TaxID=1859460 RepID=A0ABT3FUB8_9BACT|nr:SgcJ/EcaC family oxidoreductase [Luteolibacter flavescens]MCW1887178.1 SgcJ/EcaC family oxidoreductase [Luteolibacter flavescens]